MRQYLVILVIVLLLILFLLKVNKNNNNIDIKESFDTLDAVAGKAELTPKEIIDSSERTIQKSDISVIDKSIDEKLLNEFVKVQLGKAEPPAPNSYSTSAKIIGNYPEEKKELDEKQEYIPPIQDDSEPKDYNTIKKEQKHKIYKKRTEQDLTLKNIKYELIKMLKIKENVHSLKFKYGDNIEGNFKARLNEIAKLMNDINTMDDYQWEKKLSAEDKVGKLTDLLGDLNLSGNKQSVGKIEKAVTNAKESPLVVQDDKEKIIKFGDTVLNSRDDIVKRYDQINSTGVKAYNLIKPLLKPHFSKILNNLLEIQKLI